MIDVVAEMRRFAADTALPMEVRTVAEKLAEIHEVQADQYLPDVVHPIDPEFEQLYLERASEGLAVAKESSIAIVGMARDISGILPVNLARLQVIGELFREAHYIVYENDSSDDTKDVLRRWQEQTPNAHAECVDYGYERLHGFEASRVERYAMFRGRCQELVKEKCPNVSYVLVVDLDPWGGWSVSGLCNGLGWMQHVPDAGCMASVSMYQQQILDDNCIWLHYDNWAFRWQGWQKRLDGWFSLWLPPPGAPPLGVLSAFGAGAMYRAEAYLAGKYASIEGDIEHAGFHKSLTEAGWTIWLNPAQRTLMNWVPNGGNHRDNPSGDVRG